MEIIGPQKSAERSGQVKLLISTLIFILSTVSVIGSGQAKIINIPLDYETIQDGINAARNGDTILVQPGKYTGRIDLTGKNIVIGSLYLTTGDSSYVSRTVLSRGRVIFSGGENSSCQLIGFTIRESNGAIYCSNSSPLIAYCIMVNNSAIDHFDVGIIECYDSSPTFRNCVIVRSFEIAGQFGSGWAIMCNGSSSPIIINSTIAHNEKISGGAIANWGEGMPILMNCIIWKNGGSAIRFMQSQSAPLIIYSDIQGGWDAEGNIADDPMFVQPENNNFRLQRNSPCIESGSAFLVVNYDTLVNLKPNEYIGSVPDMGALESDSVATKEVPTEFKLYPNYPNPFNAVTNIPYQLPVASSIELSIYNVYGRLIEIFVRENVEAGYHLIRWDASKHSSGLYLCKIRASGYSAVGKAILLK